jgi:hypothetical protein
MLTLVCVDLPGWAICLMGKLAARSKAISVSSSCPGPHGAYPRLNPMLTLVVPAGFESWKQYRSPCTMFNSLFQSSFPSTVLPVLAAYLRWDPTSLGLQYSTQDSHLKEASEAHRNPGNQAGGAEVTSQDHTCQLSQLMLTLPVRQLPMNWRFFSAY